MTGQSDQIEAPVSLRPALADDVGHVRAILTAAAHDLTARFGEGHWSGVRSLDALQKYATARTLYLIETEDEAIGTLRLPTARFRSTAEIGSQIQTTPRVSAGYGDRPGAAAPWL